MSEAIGGYFELELNKKPLFHKDAIALNSGRSGFEYILLANKYTKVFIPYYTCDVLLQPLKRNNITYEFYVINERLEPVFDFEKLKPNEAFLYTNYFGLKDDYVEFITSRYSNIIIDNAQSFFSMPQNGADTFYSPRKFFGLPDGGYVYCKKSLDFDFEKDQTSIDRMAHLLKRLAFDAETGYEDFKRNDEDLNDQPMLQMSELTKKIISNIDYEAVKLIRFENSSFLHNKLKSTNKLLFDLNQNQTLMVYPYWKKELALKSKLQKNKIYCPTYWPNVKEWCNPDSLEYCMMNEVVFLPVDQRYGLKDMKFITESINKINK